VKTPAFLPDNANNLEQLKCRWRRICQISVRYTECITKDIHGGGIPGAGSTPHTHTHFHFHFPALTQTVIALRALCWQLSSGIRWGGLEKLGGKSGENLRKKGDC